MKNWVIGVLALSSAPLFGEHKKIHRPSEQTFMNGQVGVLTPPSTPQTGANHIFLTGDFLYWIAREDGLEYDLQSATALGSVMEDIAIRQPSFQWTPAFRATFGVRIPPDYWELKGEWTRFQTQATQTTNAVPGTLNNVVYDDSAAFTESADSTSISADWRLLFNQINVGFSRGFFLGTNLSSEIAFGGVGLWIHQKLAMECPNFVTTAFSYPALPGEFNLTPHFQNNYNAGGLFVRAKPQWNFLPSWSLLASGTGYLVHGNFNVSQSWFVAELDGNDLSLTKNYTRTRMGLQGTLGIQWQSSTLNDRWHVALSAQYEGLIWFKQNLLSQVNTIFAENYERRGDLEMQGLAVSARVDF